MAKKTTPEVVEQNLRQAYDPDYYASRRSLIRFTLGERLDQSRGYSGGINGEIPDDVDIVPRFYEPGQSRMILSNAFLMAAKVCYMEPDPDYPDKPTMKETVTKAFNQALYKGRPYVDPVTLEEIPEWAPELHRMYVDADGLGTGFVQIGVRNGWTTIQHHPLSRVIWDRHRLGVSRARFIAFIHYLPEEEAVSMFGESARKHVAMRGETGHTLRTMKAVQYFDLGLGVNAPTEMWRLNALGGPVLDASENKYGCLPYAHMEHIHMFGMRRAMGRIDFQVSDQQMRNAYERYLRLVLERGPGFDVFNTSGMDIDDLERLESGELLTSVKMTLGPLERAQDRVARISPHEPPMGIYKGLEYLDRMNPANSGISDADRANVTSSPRTLGEIEAVQAGADSSQQWSQRQYARSLERLFLKVNWVAAKMHTAPTPIALNGIPLLLNEPGEPKSNLAYWLTPTAQPVVNEDRLLKESPLRKMQIADAKWIPFKDDPFMNPVEVRRRWLQDRGEKDPDKLLNPQAIMASQGMVGGDMTDALALTGRQDALPQASVPA